MAKPSMFTKAGNKPYKLPVGENYYIQVPKWQAEQIIMQKMNRGGFDVATKVAQKQAEAFWEDTLENSIQKQVEHYKQAKEKAKKLSEKLKNGAQIINNPLEYAFKKAKSKLEEEYEISDSASGLAQKGTLVKYAGVQALETVAEIVLSRADAAVSRYCTLQEDYLTQQTTANVKDTISRAQRGLTSIANGFATGLASAGPVGAVIGAVASAASFGNSQYMEYQQKMSGYYQQLNATNFQTNYSSSRLGLVNNGRGTEN
jgi:hypothetical protein